MKLELDAVIKNIDETPIKVDTDKEKILTLKDVCINSLLAMFDEEKHDDGTKKVSRFTLAMKLQGGDGDVTVEEMATIKERIGKMYMTVIVGRAYALIEGSDGE